MASLRVFVAGGGSCNDEREVCIPDTAHKQIFSDEFSGEDYPVLAKLSETGREGQIPVFFLRDFDEELRRISERHKGNSFALGVINSLLSLTQDAIKSGKHLYIEPGAASDTLHGGA
jgi:hypothetical protein